MICPITPEMCALELNITGIDVKIKSDSDIAGIGIMISFIVTTFLSFLIVAAISYLEYSQRGPPYLVPFLRRNLLGFSDQQLVTGIGIQVVGFSKICSLNSYHLGIIFNLAQLSTTTHIITLMKLQEYFKQHELVRNVRVFLMVVNMALLIVSGVLKSLAGKRVTGGGAPMVNRGSSIFCMFISPVSFSYEGLTVMYMLFFIAVGTLAVLGVFFPSLSALTSLNFLRRLHTVRWYRLLIQISFTLTLIGCSGLLFYYSAQQADAFRHASSKKLYDMEGTEKEWSYGQIFPLLLLVLPVLNALEIYNEIQVTPEDSSNNGTITTPLLGVLIQTSTSIGRPSTSGATIGDEDPSQTQPIRRQDTEARLEGRPTIPSSHSHEWEIGAQSRSSTFQMNDMTEVGSVLRRGSAFPTNQSASAS